MATCSPLERTANEEQVCSVLANVLHTDIDGVEMELMKKTHLFWDMQMARDTALVMFKILIMKLNGDVEENFRVITKTKGTDKRTYFHQINVFIDFGKTYLQIEKRLNEPEKHPELPWPATVPVNSESHSAEDVALMASGMSHICIFR